MAANMPAMDKAPAYIRMMDTSLSQRFSTFLRQCTLHLIGRAPASLPKAIIKQAVQVVYTPTKTKVIVETNVVDTSTPTTEGAHGMAFTLPTLAYPICAMLCAVAVITTAGWVARARAHSRRAAALTALESEASELEVSEMPTTELDGPEPGSDSKELLATRANAILKQYNFLSKCKALENDCAEKAARIAALEFKAEQQAANIVAGATALSAAKETLESLQKETARVSDETKLCEAASQQLSLKKSEEIVELEHKLNKMSIELGGLRKNTKALEAAKATITSLETAAEESRQEHEEEKQEIREKQLAAEQSAKREASVLLSKIETERRVKEQEQRAISIASAAKLAELEQKLKKASESSGKSLLGEKKAHKAAIASAAALEESKKALESANARLEAEKKARFAESEIMAAENKAQSAAYESMVAENSAHLASNSSIVAENTSLKSANETLADENIRAREEKDAAESNLEKMSAELKKQTDARMDVTRRSAGVLMQKAELQKCVDSQQEQIEALMGKILELEKQLDTKDQDEDDIVSPSSAQPPSPSPPSSGAFSSSSPPPSLGAPSTSPPPPFSGASAESSQQNEVAANSGTGDNDAGSDEQKEQEGEPDEEEESDEEHDAECEPDENKEGVDRSAAHDAERHEDSYLEESEQGDPTINNAATSTPATEGEQPIQTKRKRRRRGGRGGEKLRKREAALQRENDSLTVDESDQTLNDEPEQQQNEPEEVDDTATRQAGGNEDMATNELDPTVNPFTFRPSTAQPTKKHRSRCPKKHSLKKAIHQNTHGRTVEGVLHVPTGPKAMRQAMDFSSGLPRNPFGPQDPPGRY
ncbi:uncharacterized protein RCC_01491 [Ramularia collo-cygni]|uniref:Uncharacterized protein n=1 Tax=Ramularia collo-cygni TaxID=112498 RepID=A0A2D3UZM6_9PEZI|nr:uncharacterized protein RCC_01491 [Ramularia collo-cygni]CZT15654.1 uncharacterized protein RCC_01491 [Ramularia collo-cygni]